MQNRDEVKTAGHTKLLVHKTTATERKKKWENKLKTILNK